MWKVKSMKRVNEFGSYSKQISLFLLKLFRVLKYKIYCAEILPNFMKQRHLIAAEEMLY